MEFITTEQIIAHRNGRKTSGLVGCIDGSDTNINSLSGISWRPADPLNPHCFCHDCRSLWDKSGEIDLELIKQGNERALFVYASILPKKKDILRDLRSKTDDALEDFVKAQMELFAKMAETKAAQSEYDKRSEELSKMNAMGYAYLKAREREIDEIEMDLFIRFNHIKSLKVEEFELEEKCHTTEAALSAARKEEHEFLEKNL